MRLRDFGILTNENIHPAVIDFLRGHGFSVRTGREAALLGADDSAVLRRAADLRLAPHA